MGNTKNPLVIRVGRAVRSVDMQTARSTYHRTLCCSYSLWLLDLFPTRYTFLSAGPGAPASSCIILLQLLRLQRKRAVC
jgi:hypothetical protein